MAVETYPFDPARYLDSEEGYTAYMDEARRTGDPEFIARSQEVVARARRYAARGPRACRIEDLPDDLADELEAGLDDLWNPETVVEKGDNIIS